MLKIKDNVNLDILKDYGFKLDPHHEYWYKELEEDIEIQINSRENDCFKKREIIIYTQTGAYINSLNILYFLINDGLVEATNNIGGKYGI